MRSHHTPTARTTATSRTITTSRLALVTAVCLLASACSNAEEASPSADAVSPSAAQSPAASQQTAVDPDTSAATDSAVEFFAAFDEIVLTGDETRWTERSSPDCYYCTSMAAFGASFGLGAGIQTEGAEADGGDGSSETLADLGLSGFDVRVVQATTADDATVAVDLEIELLLTELAPLSPGMIAPDGTVDAAAVLGSAGGPQPARVTMTHDGGTWTVLDITRVPDGESEPDAVPATEPASDMAHGDLDGAVAALEHYLALEQEVYRTGDTVELEEMGPEQCTSCQARREIAVDSYGAGFEIEAGRSRVELLRRVAPEEVAAPEDLDPERDKDIYLLDTRVHTTETTLRTPDGTDTIPAGEHGLAATLLYGPDGRWYVGSLVETE